MKGSEFCAIIVGFRAMIYHEEWDSIEWFLGKLMRSGLSRDERDIIMVVVGGRVPETNVRLFACYCAEKD